jgi:DNA (cytosine-5)-methyltransferase 1
MKHGSLFSGIGGFDLASEWMGWENVFHCEWNPFGKKILKHYWPKAESFEDITKTDFTKYANTIDILTGGFPCQPYSTAGKRKGKEDERHLWPEMLRAISEISPRFVVGENVRGLLNWGGGLVFDEVCSELENYGYQVAPIVIPAAAVNAPHGRDRIWFVAYRGKFRLEQCEDTTEMGTRQKEIFGKGNQSSLQPKTTSKVGDATNTNCNGFDECHRHNEINPSQGWVNAFGDIESCNGHGNVANTTSPRRGKDNRIGESRFNHQKNSPNNWDNFPSESPICSGDDGIPNNLDGITFPKWRQESIKGFGNAIVPQVAFEIFKAIQQCDNESLL